MLISSRDILNTIQDVIEKGLVTPGNTVPALGEKYDLPG